MSDIILEDNKITILGDRNSIRKITLSKTQLNRFNKIYHGIEN